MTGVEFGERVKYRALNVSLLKFSRCTNVQK
jgi:hypothetical protein